MSKYCSSPHQTVLNYLKYLMLECFKNSSEYMDPKTRFYKKNSVKPAKITLYSAQAILVHSKGFICYLFLLLHLFIWCQFILQAQPFGWLEHKAILNIFLQLKRKLMKTIEEKTTLNLAQISPSNFH